MSARKTKTIFPVTILSTLITLRGHYLKPRDVVRLGIQDHYVITWLGIALSALARAGLAKRLNNSRPRRYLIKPWVAERIATYRLRCFRGLYCPHVGSCPVREALKGVVRCEG